MHFDTWCRACLPGRHCDFGRSSLVGALAHDPGLVNGSVIADSHYSEEQLGRFIDVLRR
jgi:hypothetical protein